jgi:hypothetical protein
MLVFSEGSNSTVGGEWWISSVRTSASEKLRASVRSVMIRAMEPISDGKELFYQHDGEMIAVKVDSEREFSAGGFHVLFTETAYLRESVARAPYDVSPDGKSFLMVRREPGSIPTRIKIVLNWFEELKKRVPVP